MRETFDYDARGNLIEHEDVDGGISRFIYDARGMMTRAELPDGTWLTQAYDEEGNRIQESHSNGETVHYLWDEFSRYGDVVYETDGMGSERYHYTMLGEMVLSQHTPTTTQYLLGDMQNSTIAVTDPNGQVTSEYDYSAFGELLDETVPGVENAPAEPETDYLYAGQQYVPALGLYAMRARYYAPGEGRFLSRDAYAYNYRNPVELNRYVYTANNPVNGTDPTGLFTLPSYATVKATVGTLAIGGLAFGVGQVAIDALFSVLFGFEFAPVKSFLNGAITGMLGVGAGLAAAKVLGKFGVWVVTTLTDIGAGTMWDMLIEEMNFWAALPANALGSLAGEAAGTILEGMLARLARALDGTFLEGLLDGWRRNVDEADDGNPDGGNPDDGNPDKGGDGDEPDRNPDPTPDIYREVYLYGSGGKGDDLAELDVVLLSEGKIIENKDGRGLSHPMNTQSPAQWAQEQIYNAGASKMNAIPMAQGTYIPGQDQSPSSSELNAIRTFEFQVMSTDSNVQNAVNNQINQLQRDFPGWNIGVTFGDNY